MRGTARALAGEGSGPIYRLPQAYSLPNEPPGAVLGKLLQMQNGQKPFLGHFRVNMLECLLFDVFLILMLTLT